MAKSIYHGKENCRFNNKVQTFRSFLRSILALKLKPVIAEKAKAQQVRTAENRVRQISDRQEIDTKKELAKVAERLVRSLTKRKRLIRNLISKSVSQKSVEQTFV